MQPAINPSMYAKPLHDLLKTGRRYRFPKGQILQTSDDRIKLNLIVSGYIKRYLIGNDGALGVQYIIGPNYIFPLTPVFKTLLDQVIYSGPEVYYYQCMTPMEIYSLDQESLKIAVANNPLLYKALFAESGIRLQDNIHRLENIALKSSYKRLAHQIAYYSRQFGAKQTSGIKLNIPLTHQDFADSLSLTRETISTSMIRLRKKGLIKTGKDIVVKDIEKLEEEAYS